MQHFVVTHGYLAVLILMVAESACIPFPSELTMLLGGALAAGAIADHHLSLVGIIAVGVLGNVLGSYLAWAVGRYGGQPAVRRWGRWVLLNEHDVERAQRWFDRHGGAAVFFGRLLPVVRTFISLPAGFAAMPPARFGLYTLAGCLPWSAGLAVTGYVVGDRWHAIVDDLHGPTLVVAAVAAVAVLVFVVVQARRRTGTGRHRQLTGRP